MRLIYLVAFIATVLIAGIAFYCVKSKASVVLFDAEAIKGTLIRQLAEHRATEVQVSAAIIKFNDSLNAVLGDYAKRNGVVILNKRTVLAGGEDVTEQLTGELSRTIRAQS